MKKIQLSKEDHEEAKKAYDLLIDFANSHPEIKFNNLISAMQGIIANAFFSNGFSHEEFVEEMNNACHAYKYLFEKGRNGRF